MVWAKGASPRDECAACTVEEDPGLRHEVQKLPLDDCGLILARTPDVGDKRVVAVLWSKRDSWLLAILEAERAVTGRLEGFKRNHDEDNDEKSSTPYATGNRDAEGTFKAKCAAHVLAFFTQADENARLKQHQEEDLLHNVESATYDISIRVLVDREDDE